jgi:hypothetical protein
MSQMKTIKWTNPAGAVARNESVGFEVAEVTTTDLTNGGQWYWNDQMVSGTDIHVDAGTVDAANGFTPLAQHSVYGAAITAFTNANPGVITADYIAQCGIVAGDTIKVVGIADNMTAVSLNGQYVVASVTATAITLTTSTAALSVYVSGGTVTRVKDTAGNPIPTQNFAIQGITIGTAAVGAGNAVMTAVFKGKNCVV